MSACLLISLSFSGQLTPPRRTFAEKSGSMVGKASRNVANISPTQQFSFGIALEKLAACKCILR
jgi:hypothetical protein